MERCGLTHTGPVGRELEARRALAAVAARDVDAVGVALAQVVSAAALIDVYRGGGGDGPSVTGPITVRWCSSRRSGETSGAVWTRTCTIVFSFTFTDEQYVVVAEAHRTFAAEAPDLVDAHAVGADAGDLPALVDVCTNQERSGSEWKPLLDSAARGSVLTDGFSRVDVDDEAGSLVAAQQPILR